MGLGYLIAFLLGSLMTALLIQGHEDRDEDRRPNVDDHLMTIYDEIARIRYRIDRRETMAMEKHGNTLFPNDRVARRGQKTASGGGGKLTDKTESGPRGDLRVGVEWDDGTSTFEDPGSLERA